MNRQAKIEAQFATVDARTLRAALKPIMAVVDQHVAMPILKTVKLNANGRQLVITGTDLDIEISAEMDLNDGDGDWSLCVDAKAFSSIARAAGAAPVMLMPVVGYASKLLVSIDDRVEYELLTSSAEDFLNTGDSDCRRGKLIERFANGQLADGLRRVRHCISKEEIRYYLNGVRWERGEEKCRFTATDGARLVSHTYAAGVEEQAERIIPRKLVALICNHFRKDDVSVFATNRFATIDLVSGSFTIRGRLIDGKYPDVDRYIPSPAKKHLALRIGCETLRRMLMQATVFSSSHYSRTVRIFAASGAIAIEQKNVDLGIATVHSDAPFPENAPHSEFAVNAAYLREILDTCTGEITIIQNDITHPILISDADDTMTRVVMPMRY